MSSSRRNEDIPIVLIHLGQASPRQLIRAAMYHVEQSREVHLASDEHVLRGVVKGARCHKFPAGKHSQEIAAALGRMASFRQGFWAMTAARFSVLAAVQARLQRPVLHIENDVILNPSFRPASSPMANTILSFGLLGRDTASGAILYSRDHVHSSYLSQAVSSYFLDGAVTNEMQALYKFMLENPHLVTVLPTAPDSSTAWFQESVPAALRERASHGASEYGGIFDVAGIGQFYLGTDPRNARGFSFLFREFEDQLVRAGNLPLKSAIQNWPHLVVGERQFGLLNLHVHSKDKRAFSANSLGALLRRRLAGRGKVKRVLSLGAFLHSAANLISRRCRYWRDV